MFGSSAVASAAKWIASTLIEEGKYLYEVEREIHNLHSELKHMQQHLQDAYAKVPLNEYREEQLQIFTDDIRMLAFRAEDDVDLYIVDVSTKTSTKSFFKKAACLMIHGRPIHEVRKEVDAIVEEAKWANERLERYKGKEATSVRSEASSSRPAIENYVLLETEDQLRVVGINEDIERFAKRLTSDIDDSQDLAIVGEGGAGKSTLAAKLYCHPNVAERFSCKAHISISQQWSGSDILSKIYKQCTGNENTVKAQEVNDFLKEERYLIVLDDIWTTDAWDYVSPAFPPNKYGRIILTTRNRDLPSHIDQLRTCTIHEPKKLTKDEKWELFSKMAIQGQPFADDKFKQLGKELLERCDALPLTVVTLAGILRAKHHAHEWERIKKALFERILEAKGNHGYGVAGDMIALSYDSLPPHIKLCFLYLAIFPEDMVIYIPSLISMWIAEGFVSEDQLRGDEMLEDAARNVVDELARCCMVQISKRDLLGEIQEFHMHDIVREHCIAKAKQQHFVEIVSPADIERNNTMEARRVSIHSHPSPFYAHTHLDPNDPEWVDAATKDGWDIKLTCQHVNSPDLNILDLGFFRAIQSLQQEKCTKTVDELLCAVKEAFEELEAATLNKVWLTLQLCMCEVIRAKGSNNYKILHIEKDRLFRQGILPTVISVEDLFLVQDIIDLEELSTAGTSTNLIEQFSLEDDDDLSN